MLPLLGVASLVGANLTNAVHEIASYALGLGAAFLVAGLAFVRAMGAFRWLRDRYNLIRIASGIVLGALLGLPRQQPSQRTNWYWLIAGSFAIFAAVMLIRFTIVKR